MEYLKINCKNLEMNFEKYGDVFNCIAINETNQNMVYERRIKDGNILNCYEVIKPCYYTNDDETVVRLYPNTSTWGIKGKTTTNYDTAIKLMNDGW